MFGFTDRDYDMVVIGGGAAGLVAAGMSASLGAKTALVESHRLGGDCTWTGCVPSKTLLDAARDAHIRQSPADFPAVMEHVRQIRQEIYEDADAPPNLEKLGVEVIQAKARFTDPRRLHLDLEGGRTRAISSRYFVIASGSSPRQPDFADLCLTNESIFEIEKLPERLLIIGAGPVGTEMAQAFCRLGSKVTVVESGDRILAHDEPCLAEELQKALRAEGVAYRMGAKVEDAQRQDERIAAKLDDGSEIRCDAILAAIGRSPNVEGLGLEKAGVDSSRKGIQVGDGCRTSVSHIYAAGDIATPYQFTHFAEHMAKVAVQNALIKWPARLDKKHITWCTYTSPELARVGASEEQVRQRGQPHRVFRFSFKKIDRAITEGKTTGQIKVIATRSGQILGASILGAHAGEMIVEWALAMKEGIPLGRISKLIHPYPTYMLGNRRAADGWYTSQLDSPWLGVLGSLFGYRGERKGSQALE